MIFIAAKTIEQAEAHARSMSLEAGEWKWMGMGSNKWVSVGDVGHIAADERTPDFIASLMMAMQHGGKND